jgi:hypothetical protein
LLQRYQVRGAASTTHRVTTAAGKTKLAVPAQDLSRFYGALAREAGFFFAAEIPGETSAFSIDLKVSNLKHMDSMSEVLEGPSASTRAQPESTPPGLLAFAHYAAALLEKVYGTSHLFLVYAAKSIDRQTKYTAVQMRVHFPGVLVNAERHAGLSTKIKDSLTYKTNRARVTTGLFSQVLALGDYLRVCCPQQNSWRAALRQQHYQEANGFPMVCSYVAMNFVHHLTNFRRLVCGCMGSYDSEPSHILQHFSSSTR